MSSLAAVSEMVYGQICEKEASSGDGYSGSCNTLITVSMGNNNEKLRSIMGSHGDRSSQGGKFCLEVQSTGSSHGHGGIALYLTLSG